MSTKQEKAACQPFTRTIAGKKWTFSPIENGEWVKMRAHAHEQYSTAMEALGESYDKLPESIRADAINRALEQDQAKEKVLAQSQWDAYLGSKAGTSRFFWLSLKHAHPEVTEEEVLEQVVIPFAENEAVGVGIVEKILSVSGLLEGKKSSKKKRGEKRA